MAETKCTRCMGTGYANAARDSGREDAPTMWRPLGVYRCPSCGGSGKVGFPDDITEALRDAIKRMYLRGKE